MKKLNNKGVTIVELILTFALLMVLVLGMFDVITEIKSYSSRKQIEKDIIEFNNLMIYTIQEDLIKKDAEKITSSSSNQKISVTITFDDNSTKTLIINLREKTITYDKITYDMPQKSMIEFIDNRIIQLCSNSAYTTKKTCENNGATWNTNYTSYYNVTINSDNNIITIDIPYFIIGETKNYGFKIVHPIGI